MERGARQAVVLRYRDGRSDRGYFQGLGPGVVRVVILRGRDQELHTVLPLSMVEAIHFVVDLNQAPLTTLTQAAPRAPMVGKSVEVHCASWSLKGTCVHTEDLGFFLVPADARSNSARVFFPEGSPQLVETSDLPSPPADPDEEDGFLDVRTGQLVESRDLGRPSSPMGSLMDLDPFAGSLRDLSMPASGRDSSGPPPALSWDPAGTGPLPSLPRLEALMPAISEPLLPAEVEALIGFDSVRPWSHAQAPGAIDFWADPWKSASPSAPVRQPPEMLLPFPSSGDIVPRGAAAQKNAVGPTELEEDEWEIDVESPVPSPQAPGFPFAARDLIDTE